MEPPLLWKCCTWLHGGYILPTKICAAYCSTRLNLRELHLVQGGTLNDATVLEVAVGCPLLERIEAAGMTLLTDASIIALAQRGPLLRKINLSECTLLTDASVIAIAQHCLHLTHLNLHNPDKLQLPPEDQLHLIFTAGGIPKMYATPTTSISNVSIAALSVHSRQLRQLDVQGHANISQDALSTLRLELPRCAVHKQLHIR